MYELPDNNPSSAKMGATHLELYLIEIITRITASLCQINVEWDKELKLLIPVTTKFKKFAFRLNICLFCCLILWTTLRLYRIHIAQSESLHLLLEILNAVVSMTYFFLFVGILEFGRSNDQLVLLFNQVLVFDRENGKICWDQQQNYKKRERYFLVSAYILLLGL